jgi:ATP-dependent RNA helicase HelY
MIFKFKLVTRLKMGKEFWLRPQLALEKTVVGEFAAFSALAKGKKCFYTTPIKALSNQKFAEFCEKFWRSPSRSTNW